MLRAPPPFWALHSQQTAKKADTDTDKADDNADQQQGITGHGSGDSADPADSGGEHLGNDADKGSHGHSGSFLLNHSSLM